MDQDGVIEVITNMCQFGMKTTYRGEEGLASKPTRFLTSSPEVAKRLAKVCDSECKDQNKHIAVWGARARAAQRYPQDLCRAVVAGVKAENMRRDTNLCEIDIDVVVELSNMECENAGTRHEDELSEWARAWDDVTGKALDPKEVVTARQQEMKYVNDLKVYDVVPVEECYQVTG